jgi:hypothetical protein
MKELLEDLGGTKIQDEKNNNQRGQS